MTTPPDDAAAMDDALAIANRVAPDDAPWPMDATTLRLYIAQGIIVARRQDREA